MLKLRFYSVIKSDQHVPKHLSFQGLWVHIILIYGGEDLRLITYEHYFFKTPLKKKFKGSRSMKPLLSIQCWEKCLIKKSYKGVE